MFPHEREFKEHLPPVLPFWCVWFHLHNHPTLRFSLEKTFGTCCVYKDSGSFCIRRAFIQTPPGGSRTFVGEDVV